LTEEIDVVCREKGFFVFILLTQRRVRSGTWFPFFTLLMAEKKEKEKKRESGETHPKLGINDTYWIGKKHSPRAGKSRKKTEKRAREKVNNDN